MVGIIIDPLDRVFMHEPACPQHCLVRPNGCQRECDYMVATKMMPAIGLSPNGQARRFRLCKWADQFLARKLAINRLRHRAICQCQTRNAMPPTIGKLYQVAVNAQGPYAQEEKLVDDFKAFYVSRAKAALAQVQS